MQTEQRLPSPLTSTSLSSPQTAADSHSLSHWIDQHIVLYRTTTSVAMFFFAFVALYRLQQHRMFRRYSSASDVPDSLIQSRAFLRGVLLGLDAGGRVRVRHTPPIGIPFTTASSCLLVEPFGLHLRPEGERHIDALSGRPCQVRLLARANGRAEPAAIVGDIFVRTGGLRWHDLGRDLVRRGGAEVDIQTLAAIRENDMDAMALCRRVETLLAERSNPFFEGGILSSALRRIKAFFK